jgi:actin-related protein
VSSVCPPNAAQVPPAVFELPDGRKITVDGATRAAMAEPLFDPQMCGEASGGLAQLVAQCIRQRDKDGVLQSEVHGKDGTENWYRSIVLAGGSTQFSGLESRLQAELMRSAPDGCTPAICTPLPSASHACAAIHATCMRT